jgi:uncharacterized protein (TIGR00251 family)
MVKVEKADNGVIVDVRVRAGARRTGAAGERDGALLVDVNAAPEKGKANRAVAEVLGGLFNVAKSSVQLVSGATSVNKRFLIAGVSAPEARQFLDAIT